MQDLSGQVMHLWRHGPTGEKLGHTDLGRRHVPRGEEARHGGGRLTRLQCGVDGPRLGSGPPARRGRHGAGRGAHHGCRRAPVRKRSPEVDQLQGMAQTPEGLGVAEEQVAPGAETVRDGGDEAFHDVPLEVDAHVREAHDVPRATPRRGVRDQVGALEAHDPPESRDGLEKALDEAEPAP